jgi:hypothetical protein
LAGVLCAAVKPTAANRANGKIAIVRFCIRPPLYPRLF